MLCSRRPTFEKWANSAMPQAITNDKMLSAGSTSGSGTT